MGSRRAMARKLVLLVGAAALGVATLASSAAPAARVAGPGDAVPVRFQRLAGFAAPGTPAKYSAPMGSEAPRRLEGIVW